MRFRLLPAAVLLLCIAPCAQAAPARSDLTVTRIDVTAKVTLNARQPAVLNFTVANAGHAAARATTARVLLSANRVADAHDQVVASVRIAAVPAGGHRAARAALRVRPISVSQARYVIVCADATRAAGEDSETNNCSATHQRLRVHALPPPLAAPALAQANAFQSSADPQTICRLLTPRAQAENIAAINSDLNTSFTACPDAVQVALERYGPPAQMPTLTAANCAVTISGQTAVIEQVSDLRLVEVFGRAPSRSYRDQTLRIRLVLTDGVWLVDDDQTDYNGSGSYGE